MSAPASNMPLGSLFNLPNVSRPMFEQENNTDVPVTLNGGTGATVNLPSTFKKTDVVYEWMLDAEIAQTVTPGTQTVTPSPYFPYDMVGRLELELQNKYKPLAVSNGFDAKLFEWIRRDWRHSSSAAPFMDESAAGSAYSEQANLVSAANYSASSPNIHLQYKMPAGIWMDRYYEIDPSTGYAIDPKSGTLIPPVRMFVNPQLMAGADKIVGPRIRFNPLLADQGNDGPYMASGTNTTPATASATATLNFWREGYYQPQSPLDTPPSSPWQYVRQTEHHTVGQSTKFDLDIEFGGQILCLFYRFYDPTSTAITGITGAPMDVSNINRISLEYGSGLTRFDDTPMTAQRRFIHQHGWRPPLGVVVHDLAIDKYGWLSNGSGVINSLVQAGVHAHVELAAPMGAGSFVEVGVEGFQYSVSM